MEQEILGAQAAVVLILGLEMLERLAVLELLVKDLLVV